ncbi:MAG: cytidine deaminase [Ignavibacteriae bacterium]|nr:cytidine deaminase [Ignavibacteria bacterium]MBI3363671.1 cytidine deaminase [Ignavibacteriota bacterium]
MKYSTLVQAAKKAKRYSYAPYSNFRVGAAVLTKSGKIYTGCNIENSSYSLTICAERTALFKALSESRPTFTALAITSDSDELIPPCGACRQVIMDLAGDIDIILTSNDGAMKIMKSSELLPLPFTKYALRKFPRKT